MALHRVHNESHQIYFCTITCYKWLPLIEDADAYHTVYRWFEHLKKDGCKVVGYVIMPNHFHVMLYLTHTGTSINKMVGECKRFMAYDIVQALKRSGKTRLLDTLAAGVQPREKFKGKLHQVFRISFDARSVLAKRWCGRNWIICIVTQLVANGIWRMILQNTNILARGITN